MIVCVSDYPITVLFFDEDTESRYILSNGNCLILWKRSSIKGLEILPKFHKNVAICLIAWTSNKSKHWIWSALILSRDSIIKADQQSNTVWALKKILELFVR